MTESTDQLYERLLVLRSQAGDEAAFAELVERYHRRLRYYLRKMLGGDAHHADDALQEVWLDVYRGLPRLKDAGAFPAWLYRIARHRAYRLMRDLGRGRVQTASSLSDVNTDVTGAAAADETFSPEDAATIHAALDRLAPEQREVLILRFVEEMDYVRISSVTGVPVGTVRSRIYYAKLALRRLIERTDEHEQRKRTERGAVGL